MTSLSKEGVWSLRLNRYFTTSWLTLATIMTGYCLSRDQVSNTHPDGLSPCWLKAVTVIQQNTCSALGVPGWASCLCCKVREATLSQGKSPRNGEPEVGGPEDSSVLQLASFCSLSFNLSGEV